MEHIGASIGVFGDHSGYALAMSDTDVVKTWGEQVPAAQVVKLAGLRKGDIYNLRDRGLLTTVSGPRGRLLITREDAMRLLAAAAITAATAVVLATAYRLLRDSGAIVDPASGVMIPVQFPQVRQFTAGDVMAA